MFITSDSEYKSDKLVLNTCGTEFKLGWLVLITCDS